MTFEAVLDSRDDRKASAIAVSDEKGAFVTPY